jgi:hypothetical protein
MKFVKHNQLPALYQRKEIPPDSVVAVEVYPGDQNVIVLGFADNVINEFEILDYAWYEALPDIEIFDYKWHEVLPNRPVETLPARQFENNDKLLLYFKIIQAGSHFASLISDLNNDRWAKLFWLACATLVVYKLGTSVADIVMGVINAPRPVLL